MAPDNMAYNKSSRTYIRCSGFQTLVDKVYLNLPMMRGVGYVEADRRRVLARRADCGETDTMV
ncbi:hypothetical protein A9D12_08090 [Erythrobacter neustonensis]|uniref:Uncharacterized protein n=1 Tax=Erythrobacter neustonensis TaxID=1112 RepID=A0A192D4F9_9SPHN|nr:hypothetical protein A9D12_08090 [Erythrobacter neustonensis]